MLKKILLLGAAIAALVTVSAPAAQAEHFWKLNGVNIPKEETVTFSGATNVELIGGAWGLHFNATATIRLKNGTIPVGGNAGTVTEFLVSNCTGTGQLNGLPCTSTTAVQSWPVTLNANTTLTIGVNLVLHHYADVGHTVKMGTSTMGGPVVVALDVPANIKLGTLAAGAGFRWNGSPVPLNGTLALTTPGTWSLGK